MKKIDEKLKKVYDFTFEYIEENGYPPSVREICDAVGIKSTATTYYYLEKLKSQGVLSKSPLKKRAITINNREKQTFKSVPLVGTVRAGIPILAVENLEGYIPLPDGFNAENEFALKVNGDSMINAGILNDDIIIVKECASAENGEIVVALVDDSATVKRFYKRDGKIILHPENDFMEDMVFEDVSILGVVKGLMRKF